ncbi:hypothetical protein HDU93_004817, partial [Gonapodya sp. JEL0774]
HKFFGVDVPPPSENMIVLQDELQKRSDHVGFWMRVRAKVTMRTPSPTKDTHTSLTRLYVDFADFCRLTMRLPTREIYDRPRFRSCIVASLGEDPIQDLETGEELVGIVLK